MSGRMRRIATREPADGGGWPPAYAEAMMMPEKKATTLARNAVLITQPILCLCVSVMIQFCSLEPELHPSDKVTRLPFLGFSGNAGGWH